MGAWCGGPEGPEGPLAPFKPDPVRHLCHQLSGSAQRLRPGPPTLRGGIKDRARPANAGP
jgi:hypothetical protein